MRPKNNIYIYYIEVQITKVFREKEPIEQGREAISLRELLVQ